MATCALEAHGLADAQFALGFAGLADQVVEPLPVHAPVGGNEVGVADVVGRLQLGAARRTRILRLLHDAVLRGVVGQADHCVAFVFFDQVALLVVQRVVENQTILLAWVCDDDTLGLGTHLGKLVLFPVPD